MDKWVLLLSSGTFPIEAFVGLFAVILLLMFMSIKTNLSKIGVGTIFLFMFLVFFSPIIFFGIVLFGENFTHKKQDICQIISLEKNECQTYLVYDSSKETLNFSLILIKQVKPKNLYKVKSGETIEDPLNPNEKQLFRVELLSRRMSKAEAREWIMETNLEQLVKDHREEIKGVYLKFKGGM